MRTEAYRCSHVEIAPRPGAGIRPGPPTLNNGDGVVAGRH